MKLSEWVAKDTTERRAKLMQELGVGSAAISGYCSEPPRFKPSAERIWKIEQITGGAVKLRDWVAEAGA